jgi:hypothetical protein
VWLGELFDYPHDDNDPATDPPVRKRSRTDLRI